MKLDEWKMYMENNYGLPIGQILKTIRCVFGQMTSTNKKESLELIAKWTYEYLKIVVREKHLSTIQDILNLSRKENRIRVLPIHVLLVLWNENLKRGFKGYIKRRGVNATLDTFLKYVSMRAAKIFLENSYYDIERIGHVANEAWEDYFIMKAYSFIEDLAMDERNREIINVINQIIDRRRTYGLRTEKVPRGEFCILAWSNGWEMWYIAWGIIEYVKKHHLKEIELDANEIIVPYSCKVVSKVICFLNPLPLYVYSAEYKTRYVPSEMWGKHSVDWAIRRIESRIVNVLKRSDLHE